MKGDDVLGISVEQLGTVVIEHYVSMNNQCFGSAIALDIALDDGQGSRAFVQTLCKSE